MPGGITVDQDIGLIANVQHDLGRNKWTNLILDKQDYIALNQLMKDPSKVKEKRGTALDRQLAFGTTGNVRRGRLFNQRTYNAQDNTGKFVVPWRFTEAQVLYDTREMEMMSDETTIVDYIDQRELNTMSELTEFVENDFWGKPADESDVDTPWGIGYWITRNTVQGFNGGNPTGFSTVAGINASTQSKIRNYTDSFSAYSDTDLVEKWFIMTLELDFKPPVPNPHSTKFSDKNVYYAGRETIVNMRRLARAQNMDIGRDIMAYGTNVLVGGNLVQYVPTLNSDTQRPIYAINWDALQITFLKNNNMKKRPPRRLDANQNMIATDIEAVYNYEVLDRRRLGVLIKV